MGDTRKECFAHFLSGMPHMTRSMIVQCVSHHSRDLFRSFPECRDTHRTVRSSTHHTKNRHTSLTPLENHAQSVCGTSLEKHVEHISREAGTAVCVTSVHVPRFDNNRPSTHRNSTNMSVVHASQTKRCQSGSRAEHSHSAIAPRRLCISYSNWTSRCPIDRMLPVRCSSVSARSCSSIGRRLSRIRASSS